MSQVADLYKALELDEGADADAIKKAYRRLAKLHHPDANPGNKRAEDRFKEIGQAYEILSDPEKRRRYDAMRRSPFQGGAARGGRGPAGWPPAGYESEGGLEGGFDGGNINDLFEMFFGGGGFGGGRPGPTRGADLESEVEVSFEDAALGRPVTVQLSGAEQPVRLNLPPGAESGLRLRLGGQGRSGRGGRRGDLYLTLRVRPSAQFRREGRDVVGTIRVNLAQALLGSSVTVATLRGSRRVKLAPGLQPGTRVRLAGQGIEADGGTGDHYVELEMTLPQDLTPEEKSAVESMAQRRQWEL